MTTFYDAINVEKGEIRLRLSEKAGSVYLFMFNIGPGIPKEELEKVFEQFYRTEKSRSLQYGGSGPGLAIVREIVRLHGGRVVIESALGSVFAFSTAFRAARRWLNLTDLLVFGSLAGHRSGHFLMPGEFS